MDLYEFCSINVLNYPVFSTSLSSHCKPAKLPPAFFLHNQTHIIFVRIKHEKNQSALLYDSLGASKKDFKDFFLPYHCKIKSVFYKTLQRSMASDTCGIHAVLFSLKYFSVSNDFTLHYYIKPVLKQLCIQSKSNIPEATSLCLSLATLPLPHLQRLVDHKW